MTAPKRTWAWALALSHAVLLCILLAAKPVVPYSSPKDWILDDMVAARYFHYPEESRIMQAVAVTDFPALLLCDWTINLLATKLLHPFTASYVHAASWLLLGSGQWFLLGAMFEKTWRRNAS